MSHHNTPLHRHSPIREDDSGAESGPSDSGTTEETPSTNGTLEPISDDEEACRRWEPFANSQLQAAVGRMRDALESQLRRPLTPEENAAVAPRLQRYIVAMVVQRLVEQIRQTAREGGVSFQALCLT
jgi:hypothetical protein